MISDLMAGAWYVIVTCARCNSTVFLFRDLTEGRGAFDALYRVTCPACGHEGEYHAKHYHHSERSTS